MGSERAFWQRALEMLGKERDREEKLATGWYKEVYNRQTGEKDLIRLPKSERPYCGAKTRNGGTCNVRAMFGMTRCRMHGGLSTGPKTEEGRARIAESNRMRAQADRNR